MQSVYLDWAATSIPDAEILKEMQETAYTVFGNPSSLHTDGRRAAQLLEQSRKRCATALSCRPEEITFTSGGTEGNALVIQSLLRKRSRGHIIASGIEHASVYETVRLLKMMEYPITFIPAEKDGRVSPGRIREALQADTVLVTVMAVNNETGAVQPVREIADILKSSGSKRRIHLHCDAVQAFGKIPLLPADSGADTLSLSAHKFRGPRGAGLLYSRRPLETLGAGGGQEGGVRSGTENLPAILGMSLAMEKQVALYPEQRRHAEQLCSILLEELYRIPGCTVLPGERLNRPEAYSPFIVNATFPPVPGEVLVRVMSDRGFSISTGSACSSARKKRIRVLEQMGVSEKEAFSAIRISTGSLTTEEEIRSFCEVLKTEAGMLQNAIR